MKIVLVDPATTGHHLEYAGFLADYFLGRGDEVDFVTYDRPSTGRLPEGLSSRLRTVTEDWVERPPAIGATRLARSARTLSYALALARQIQADVVHHLYVDRNELALAYSFSRGRGRDITYTVFGTLFWPYFAHLGDADVLRRAYYKTNATVLRALLRQGRLNALFVHHEDIKTRVLQALRAPRVAERIVVIPDPVETRIDERLSSDARRRLGLPNDKALFLFFGGMRYNKGPDVALDAFLRVGTRCTLVMAGSPDSVRAEDIARVRQRLSGSGKELIPRLQWISDEQASLFFQAADCVVVPYRRAYSGTSGVLQRAAAAGKPVIASDVPVLGKIVKQNGMGLTVDPGSAEDLARAIERFLRLPGEARNRMGASAREYALRCDWRTTAAMIRRTYNSSI